MSKLFHVNDTTGEVGRCRAKTLDGCPFGAAKHFDSEPLARLHAEQTLASREAYLEAVQRGPDRVPDKFTPDMKAQVLDAAQKLASMSGEHALAGGFIASKRLKVAMALNDPKKAQEILREFREARGDMVDPDSFTHGSTIRNAVRQSRKAEQMLKTMLFQRGEAPAPAPLPLPSRPAKKSRNSRALRQFSETMANTLAMERVSSAAWHREQELSYQKHLVE